MGSGEQATLNLTGDNFLQVAVPTNTKTADGQALIDVSGKVRAAGGSVQLKAATVANAIRNAVNVPGELSVASARASGGSIVLSGGAGGDVSVTGRLRASGRTKGGAISIDGHDVALRQREACREQRKGPGRFGHRDGNERGKPRRRPRSTPPARRAAAPSGSAAISTWRERPHVRSDDDDHPASTLNADATASGDGRDGRRLVDGRR